MLTQPSYMPLPAGNRPSMSIMLPSCTAYTVGQILALYEHRVAVQVGGRPVLKSAMAWMAMFPLPSVGSDR
jgi:hypothetical protein